ncbi:hypothetical protein NQ318_008190, partial [Aromia moschata]
MSYKKFKMIRNETEKAYYWEQYKYFRNTIVNMLKMKKSIYYENKIDCYRNDSKRMWKTLKTIIKGGHHELTVNKIQFDINSMESVANNEQDLAENFNLYFIRSIENLVTNRVEWNPPYEVNCNMFRFRPITLDKLTTLVNSLNNKMSVDEVLNAGMLKIAIDEIGEILLKLINTSLLTGCFPDKLKTSTITPIPKIINASNAKDFRPINSFPPVEKILEMAVYEQITEYFNSNKLLINNQSGFRKCHSCETALQLTISNFLKNIDNNKFTVTVFLDFQRAFETIDRSILLKKLQMYGVGVLNVNKTKSMIITTQYKYERLDINNINIVYENNQIELVKKIKYLGLIIDNNLTFKEHLTIANSLSIMTCITVYKSIIQPHFDYCATILYMLDKNSISALQKLQNRGMRIILRCNKYTPLNL